MDSIASRTDIWQAINMHGGDTTVCWEWLKGFCGRQDHRMPCVWIEGKNLYVPRVVYEQFYGKLPPARDEEGNRLVLRHTCDNGRAPIGCCNPHHLIVGTHQDNMNDMATRDRHGLPSHAVRIIRRRLERGDVGADIARDMGISRQAVSAIKLGNRRSGVAG